MLDYNVAAIISTNDFFTVIIATSMDCEEDLQVKVFTNE